MHRDRRLLELLSTESRLLLLVAGPASTDGEIDELLRTSAVNWDSLLRLADRERATALVWRRIRTRAADQMPATVRERFERMAMVADFTAGYLEQRIGETLARLNGRGVRALLLKGSALAVSSYGSFVERPMGDVDVVVERDRADEAFSVFQEAGWRWDAENYPRERYHGHHHYPPLLDGRGADVRLELHTGLFVSGSPFTLDSTLLFREGRVMKVGAGEAVIPSPEHLLLHTCIHYTWSHMMLFGAWRAFRDVTALQRAGLDWDKFLAEARRHRAESASYWTLRMAERLAGAVPPDTVMQRLSVSTPSRWRSICERHAAREMFPLPDRCPSEWLRRFLWTQAIQPRSAGHGSARPWLLDDMSPENMDPEGREGGMVRTVRHLPRLGAWWRYVRVLAG